MKTYEPSVRQMLIREASYHFGRFIREREGTESPGEKEKGTSGR